MRRPEGAFRLKKKELKGNFLGNCVFLWDGKPMTLGGDAAGKPVQLLQMILYYRADGVTRASAIANLFDSEGQANPINNLRNTRFRLKKLLEEEGLPPVEYVQVRGGRLYWNPALPVTLDCERFERAVARAKREKDPEKRLEAQLAACDLYEGRLLPAEMTLPWVVQEDLRLKGIFFSMVREAAAALEAKEDWPGAEALYDKAASIEPYEEEWAAGCIRCAQRQEHHREALQRYERTVSLFLDEFGVAPSEEFQQSMDGVSSSAGFSSTLELRNCIAEGFSGGAYFCHFSEFVHCCSLVSRLDARNGRATSLIWCRALPPQNEATDPTRRKDRMAACMLDTLHACLRSSDVFTRYGEGQFLILLPGSGDESCALVFDRINARFKEQKAAYGYTLSLHVVPLAPPPPEPAI
jgi:DNA-binding SARP family transcriptional activator